MSGFALICEPDSTAAPDCDKRKLTLLPPEAGQPLPEAVGWIERVQRAFVLDRHYMQYRGVVMPPTDW